MFYLNGMKKAPRGVHKSNYFTIFVIFLQTTRVVINVALVKNEFSPNVIYSPVTRVYSLR